MADFVFNISKGRFLYYATLPAANDAITVVALKATGIEADATLKDHDTLATLLAGASDEATNSGYVRKQVQASVTVSVDDSNDWATFDMPDQVWDAVAATGGDWAKLIVCYDPAITSADSAIIPMLGMDFAVSPDGTNITAQFNGSGLAKAA